MFGSLTALGIGICRAPAVSEDSAIGVIFAAFFALGVVILSRQGGFRQDLGSLLFGNILGVSTTDVWVTLVVALIVGGILPGLKSSRPHSTHDGPFCGLPRIRA
ncbi:metal ABC transporter permease [Candidatus Amarobacter glycogenicus]|uniref:metal ABC transporter permease n=1 Tax=Candidatus Amarobacter glycogenicus TaxID=3140699 RepID=UPI0031CC41BB